MFALTLTFFLLSSTCSEASVHHKKVLPADGELFSPPYADSARLSCGVVSQQMCVPIDLFLKVTIPTRTASYMHSGICSYKDKYFKPGDSFRRGCDKCFCHEFGFYCYSPMKPTSWPKKCRRVRTECGYKVIYKESPLVECRAYSWIG